MPSDKFQGPPANENTTLKTRSHKRADMEQRLRRQEAQISRLTLELSQMHTLLDTVADGIIVYDNRRQILRINAAMRAMLGEPSGPDSGKAPEDWLWNWQPRYADGTPMPEDQWPISRCLRGETLEGTASPDMLIRRPDGQDLLLNISAAPLRDIDGTITGAICTMRDVTARRQSQQAVQEQARRLKALTDANIIGILIADQERVLEANDAFLRMVGYSRADLKAGLVRWPEMTPPEYAALDAQAVADILTMGACEPFEKEYWHKDGQRIPILIGAALLEHDPPRWMCYVLNMSEQRKLEQEHIQLLNIVGHEMRTPLTSLQVRLQMALQKAKEGVIPDTGQMQKTLEDVKRLTRLVADLNEGTTLEHSQPQLEREPVDLVALCRDLAAEIAQISARPISIELPDQSLVVQADPYRMRQVLTNLLNNAVKYTAPGAAITLALRAAPGGARVEVRDQGAGIAPEAVPHLFERFYRAPGAEVFQGSHVGLGLGLYIAKKLVNAHGGEIGVQSQMGAGTTFWLTLPA